MILEFITLAVLLESYLYCASGKSFYLESSTPIDTTFDFKVALLAVIAVTVVVVLVGFLIGCVWCPHQSLKSFGHQSGIISHHYNPGKYTRKPETTTKNSEFTIFPPSPIVNQPHGLNCVNEVKFEHLPDIHPRKQQIEISSLKYPPQLAHLTYAITKELSAYTWFDESHKNFPRNQLQYIQEIGCGWFGQVLEGEAQNIIPFQRKTKVVVKILREDASQSEHASFLHEVRPFRDLNHPNIVRLLSQCLETDPLLILMEYFIMDMKAFLIQHRHDSEQLQKEGGLLSMACDIANALQHMHEHGFIWIDVATRNCVVCGDQTVKIGEYGTSIHKYKNDYYMLGDVTLPIRWCAPESVLCTKTTIEIKQLTKEANIWSFGVLLWETLEFGRQPYTNMTDDEVIQKVISQQTIQLEKPESYCVHADKLFRIMKLCWKSVGDRPMIQRVATLLKYLYENKDVPSDSSTFEIRWNALQNISKDHNISTLFSPSKIHMQFEDDFILNNKHELQKEREKLVEMDYSSEEISPSQESLSTEYKVSFRINSHISQSLQNLRGSLDDLNEEKQFQSMESLDCTEIQEKHKISFHESSEKSSDSSITAQQISDAIKDLDNMLANEASSSGETSKIASPKKKWQNEDTWSSDQEIEANSSATYNQFPPNGLHVKDNSNCKPCAWSETSRMISDIDSESIFVQLEKNCELVSNKDEFKNISQEKPQTKNKIELMQLYRTDLDQSNDWVGLPSLENKSELDKYTFIHHSNKNKLSEELEEQQIEIKNLCLPLPDQQEIISSSELDQKHKLSACTENYKSQSLLTNARDLLTGSACEELFPEARSSYVSTFFDNTVSCINSSVTVTSPACVHSASLCTSVPSVGGLSYSTVHSDLSETNNLVSSLKSNYAHCVSDSENYNLNHSCAESNLHLGSFCNNNGSRCNDSDTFLVLNSRYFTNKSRECSENADQENSYGFESIQVKGKVQDLISSNISDELLNDIDTNATTVTVDDLITNSGIYVSVETSNIPVQHDSTDPQNNFSLCDISGTSNHHMCLDYQAFQEANVNKESVTNQSVLCTSRNKPCRITDIDQKVNEKASIITVTNCDNKDDGQSSLHENEDVVLDSVIQKHPADNLFLDSDLSSNDYTFSINEEIIEDEQKNGTCLTEGKIHRVNDAHVKYVQSQVEKNQNPSIHNFCHQEAFSKDACCHEFSCNSELYKDVPLPDTLSPKTLSTVKPKAVTSECFLEKIVHSSGDFNSNWQSTAPNAGPLKFMDESSDGCTTSADKKILDLPCSFNSVYMNKQDEKADLEIYSKYDTDDFEKLVVKSFEADSSSELKSLPTESIKLETQDNKYRPPVVPCKLIDQQFSYQGIDCLKALKDETSEEPEERCARKLKQYSTPIHESFVGLASITDASGHLGDLTTVPLENECLDEILTSKEQNEYNEKESTVSSCNYRSLNMDKNIRIQLGKTENFDEENGSYQGTPAALHSSVLDECDEKCNQETSVALNPSILKNCQFPVSDDKNGTNYPDISNSQNITKPKEESRVDAKVTNPFQTAPLDEKSDENYQEIENFLHSLVSQDEDRNDSKRILDSVYCKESANRDMYTPDFDSDSDNLLSVRSSCSSASGSFECLKDLEASVPVMAQKLLNKDEIEKNACKQWDSEKSEEDIVISERHLYSEEMENCRRMSPTFENPQENVNGVAASSDCFSFSVSQDCNLSGLYSMIPEETNRYNQQLEVDSHYLQSNLLSKDIEEHTCNLDNSTSRNLEGTRLAVAGDEEIPEDVVSLQDPDEDDEELSLQYIPLSLSLSDANENEEDLYHINNCDTEKSGELDDLNCFQYQNEERKEENTVFQDIDDKHSSLKSHDNVNSVEILNEQHCDPGDQMFSDIEPGSGVQDKEILPRSQHSNFKRSFLSEVEQPVSLLLLHKCKTEDTINKGSKFEDQDLEDWNVSSNKDIKNKSDTLLESQDAININSGTVHGQTSTPSHSIEELLTSADVHTVLNGKYIDVQDFSEYSVSKDTGQDWTLVTPSYGYVNYTGEYLESNTLRKRTRGSEDSSCNFEMFESEETIIKSLDEQVPGKNLYEVLDTPDILPFVHLEEDSNEHKSRYENLTTCDLTISPSKKLLDENLLQNHSEIDNKKFKHKVDKKEEEQISHQPSTILTSEEATKEVKYLQTDNTSVVSRCDISPTKVQYLTVDSSEKEYFLVDKSVKTKPKVVKDDKLNKFKYNELALKIDTINNAVVQPKEKEHKRPMVYLNKEEPITDKKKHYKVQNKFENLEFGYEPDDSEDDNIQYGAPVSQKKVRVNKTPVFLNEWFLVDESSDGGKLKSRKIQNILGEEQHSYEYSSSKGFDFLNEDGESVLKVRDKDQEKTTEALESKWPVETLPEYLPIVVMMNKILKETEEDPYFSPGEVEDGELPTLDYELKSACGSRSSLVDLTDKKNISDYDQNFTKQFTYWKPRESSSPLEEEIYPLDVVESEDYSIEVQIGNSDYSKEQTEVIKKPSPFLGQYECEEREDETCTSVPLKSENSITEEQSNSFGFKKEYPENAGGSCSLFLHCQNLKPHDEYFIVNEHAEKEKTMENKACSLSPENEKQGKVVMVEEKTVSFDVEKQTTGEKACLLCAGDENQDKLDVIKEQVMSSNTEKQTVENKEEACSLSLDSDEQGKQLMGKEQTCSSDVDKKPVTAKEGARSSSLHNEKQDKFFTVGEKTCNSNNDIVCCSEKQDEHFMLKEQASIELTEDNIYYNDEKQDELFMVKKQTSDANDEKKQREGIVCHDSEK